MTQALRIARGRVDDRPMAIDGAPSDGRRLEWVRMYRLAPKLTRAFTTIILRPR